MRWKEIRWPETIVATMTVVGFVAPRWRGVDMGALPEWAYRAILVIVGAGLFGLARLARDYRLLHRRVFLLEDWLNNYKRAHPGS
jgi:hypothetical protein